jgi:glycosyltransferase involved in cell wall biosynthesis
MNMSRSSYLPNSTPLPQALNAGLSVAKGAYVARFDADDLYLDKYVSRMINFMLGMSADMCGKQHFFIHMSAFDCVCLHGRQYRPFANVGNQHASGSTMIMSRAVVDAIRFDESLAHGEDVDFYVRTWSRGFRIVFAPPHDHLVIRKADKAEHTWRANDLGYLVDGAAAGFLVSCSREGFEGLLNDLSSQLDT